MTRFIISNNSTFVSKWAELDKFMKIIWQQISVNKKNFLILLVFAKFLDALKFRERLKVIDSFQITVELIDCMCKAEIKTICSYIRNNRVECQLYRLGAYTSLIWSCKGSDERVRLKVTTFKDSFSNLVCTINELWSETGTTVFFLKILYPYIQH